MPHTAQSVPGGETGGDPLGTLQWPGVRYDFLGQAPFEFDERIAVRGPKFAEDALNVPIQVDASAYAGRVQRIMVVVDRNPIRKVLELEPGRMQARIAFRFKLQQASPVRALVLLDDGIWRVGSTMVEASGGGCTVPGASRADGSWSTTLGQVQAQVLKDFLQRGHGRLRLRVMHPMDTGLVAGIPAYYIEDLHAQGADGQVWWRLALFEPVSENPLLTLDFAEPPPALLRLSGRDNGGVNIRAEVRS
jgi:sulfur-oxidizing protein SoxY